MAIPITAELESLGEEQFPILISERLLNGSSTTSAGLTSILLNHQPDPSTTVTETRITPSKSDPHSCDLTIHDATQRDTFKYIGSQKPSAKYVLIFDPEDKTYTLDKIDSDFAFNLCSTPYNKNAKSLASQYPQLETTAPAPDSDDDDLFENEAAEADPDNPFDYRHYLKRRESPSPESIELDNRGPTPRPSPQPSPQPEDSSQHNRSQQAKSKPKPWPKHRPQPKRPASPPPREEADADNEESEDDGGLEVIMDPSNKPRHRFNTIRSGEQPRSLRSAASSVSPAARREESSEEESDEDEVRGPSPDQQEPSPVEDARAEDVDDLEAELARELEREPEEKDEETGGVSVARYAVSSSSESEEE
ncbi:hypothetical protein MMC13_002426 [Lambiella insularis]|nr:hypothetical protein [Lambiella insularis]